MTSIEQRHLTSTEQQINQAALRLFVEKGTTRLTISEVVTEQELLERLRLEGTVVLGGAVETPGSAAQPLRARPDGGTRSPARASAGSAVGGAGHQRRGDRWSWSFLSRPAGKHSAETSIRVTHR
jgi:hypothetical protein